MVQISWNINAATVALLPSSFALEQPISATCVMITSNRLPVFPSLICHSVLVAHEERNWKGMNVRYMYSTRLQGRSLRWGVVCVEMLTHFEEMKLTSEVQTKILYWDFPCGKKAYTL